MAGATSSDRTSSSIVQILLSYCLKLNINAQATRICRSGLNMRTEITLPRQSEREDWTDYGIFFTKLEILKSRKIEKKSNITKSSYIIFLFKYEYTYCKIT